MKNTGSTALAGALFLQLLATSAVASDAGPEWSYEGKNGPEHWGDLSPDFVQCRVGVNQSPVDITGTIDAELPPLKLDYNTYTTELINNGHTGQANVEPGNYLRVGGESFELAQFHVHTPSEHQIDGKQFLMEVHFVHTNDKGELAVVAMLIDEGSPTGEMHKYTSKIPVELNKPVPYRQALADLPPASKTEIPYYRYNGSLTTPPCTEGVRWYILKEVMTISSDLRATYYDLIGDDARGPQPVNARVILH